MSNLVRIDPNPIDWTKEDVILCSNNGVKHAPKTPSANAITVDQSWYVAGASVCDTGDYLSIVPYVIGEGRYGNYAPFRVGNFKSAVKNNGDSYALLKPLRLASPWANRSTGLEPAEKPTVQIRIYKNHKVAVLNHELVDGQDVWYVNTRFKAYYSALWDKNLNGDAKIAECFTRQPDLIRVYTDEDVEKAASQIYMKDVSGFKSQIPNYTGDLSDRHLHRMTGTSYAYTGDATTKVFENFFDVMAPEKAGLRAQWKKKSGINLDSKGYRSHWMVIDALYWAACSGNGSTQKAVETRQSALDSLVAPFASDINALSDGDDLWGRTDAGDVMFVHRSGPYYTVATFFTPNGKMVQGTLRDGKWEAGVANINRAEIRSAITANKVQTKIVSGQTAKSIFAGTVVEELVNANAPVMAPAYWSGDTPQTSSWDQIVTDKWVAPVAAMALCAENKPIVAMLRKAGLMQWYAFALGKMTWGHKLVDLFAPSTVSPRWRGAWKYDQKAKTLEDALGLPMNLLRQLNVAYDGSYRCNNINAAAFTGAFSREEYQQMSDDELQKFVGKIIQLCAASDWKRELAFEELRSTVPDFEDRRYIVQADDPAAVKVFLEARENLTPEQWSSSWVLKGDAPAVYSYKDKMIKQLSKSEIIHELTEWYFVYKNGQWRCDDEFRLENPNFRGVILPIHSTEEFRKELDALRIGQDSALVQELRNAHAYRIRKSSDPDTPYFILITSGDGTFKTLGYLGCDASKSAQMRCMLQRRQMVYRDPIDVNAFVTSLLPALRKLEAGN